MLGLKQQVEDAGKIYGSDFISSMENISGKAYLKNLLGFLKNLEIKQTSKEHKEKLLHIAYSLVHNTNHSLRKIDRINLEENKNKFPTDLNTSFDWSVKELFKIENNIKSFAWYVSLIKPDIWQDRNWKVNYFQPLLNTIYDKSKKSDAKSDIDIRRVHLLTTKDYNTHNEKLFEILITEHLYGINSKVLILDEGAISEDQDLICEGLSDIPLLDYALIYSYREEYFKKNNYNKIVLCSDIAPYFKVNANPTSENKVYVLYDYHTFNSFYEHFMTLWNFNGFIEALDVPRITSRKPIKAGNTKVRSFYEFICDDSFPITRAKLTLSSYEQLLDAYFLNNISIEANGKAHESKKQKAEKLQEVIEEVSTKKLPETEFNAKIKGELSDLIFKPIKFTPNEF